jgi:hypothetical protein
MNLCMTGDLRAGFEPYDAWVPSVQTRFFGTLCSKINFDPFGRWFRNAGSAEANHAPYGSNLGAQTRELHGSS